MKIGCLASILILASIALLPAQSASPSPSPSPTPEDKIKTWTAKMPAGEFIVRLDQISSVSTHAYLVDASAHVTEVTVATTGSEIARFYFISPVPPKVPTSIGQSGVDMLNNKAREMADQTNAGDWQKVVKNYPTSTHAHTIEYRLDSLGALDKLFKSVKKAWLDDKSVRFEP